MVKNTLYSHCMTGIVWCISIQKLFKTSSSCWAMLKTSVFVSVHSWYLSQKVDNRPNLFLISLAHIVKESFPLLYVFTIDMHHLCPCNDHEDAFTHVVSLIWKQHIVRQVGPHNWILNHSTNRACLVFPGDWGVCV